MKPGFQSFEAGLSATTPATGSRVRTATQSPDSGVRTFVQLGEVHTRQKARARWPPEVAIICAA